jgi:hypothetical protein
MSRRMRWTGHIARTGVKRKAYRRLVGKPDGKKQLGRPRRGWVNNITMEPRGIRWDRMDCIDMALYKEQWRALVNTVMNIQIP